MPDYKHTLCLVKLSYMQAHWAKEQRKRLDEIPHTPTFKEKAEKINLVKERPIREKVRCEVGLEGPQVCSGQEAEKVVPSKENRE